MEEHHQLRKVSFFIEMPEAIAMPHDSEFTFWLPDLVPELDNVVITMSENARPISFPEGRLFVYIRFCQVKAQLRLPFTDALWTVVEAATSMPKSEMHDGPMIDSYRTVIHVSTLLINGESEDGIRIAFDRCFERIRQFCRAYRTTSHQLISPVTLSRLPLGLPYAVAKLDERFSGITGWLQLHYFFPDLQPRDPLESDEIERLHVVIERQSMNDPFLSSQWQSDEARRLMNRSGDKSDAVVHAHLAAEIFLDGVLLYMLWETGTSPQEAAKLFDDGLAKRVRRDYAPRLGGNWNPSSGPMSAFKKDLLHLRGRVVHSGYEPSTEEAETALDAYLQIVEFVKNRLADKRLTYPRTTLMVLGRPGLERMGLWKGWMEAFMSDARDEPQWSTSFRDWRDAVDAIRR